MVWKLYNMLVKLISQTWVKSFDVYKLIIFCKCYYEKIGQIKIDSRKMSLYHAYALNCIE
jgi:hypothetical protein